jgi:oleate hydratase
MSDQFIGQGSFVAPEPLPQRDHSGPTGSNPSTRAWLIGGGIGPLAAAAFLVRDGHMSGERITIFDAGPTLGGSLDAGGDASVGYSMRGGRMLTADNYECTWDLFKSIPSLHDEGQTVFGETVEFNERYRSHATARLVDGRHAKPKVTSMGFSMRDRTELLKLFRTDEQTVADSCITDWLSPHFFETAF